MTLIDLFRPSLKSGSDEPALFFADSAYSFSQLDLLSDNLARSLSARYGLEKGDRAALFTANCPELVIYYLACLKLGAVMVPINVLYRDHELKYLVENARPKILLTDNDRFSLIRPLQKGFRSLKEVLVAGTPVFKSLIAPGLYREKPLPLVSADDPALMIYTSGTTGKPKGALLTHVNLTVNVVNIVHCWRWTRHDRYLSGLPLFHLHGLGNGLHGILATGCTAFILQRFKADIALDLMKREKCTLFFGVPTMYEKFLTAVEEGHEVPPSMRLYVSGSAPLSPETFTRFERVFGHKILERYGMSETSMITSNLYDGPVSRVQGTVGKPMPGISVRLVDSGKAVTSPGVTGEIQIKGPNVFQGYWQEPKKTGDSFMDGWFKSGDLGKWDEHGNLVICGRIKELIISRGFNVYPQEVVNCLSACPGISEAAVVGEPDRILGERIKAVIVPKNGGVSETEVIEYCKARLASFKVPEKVVFCEKLPRNALGKVMINALQESRN